MSVRVMMRCKRCGELWPKEDLHRHAVCCFDEWQMSPEDVWDCYEFSHFYRRPGESDTQTAEKSTEEG